MANRPVRQRGVAARQHMPQLRVGITSLSLTLVYVVVPLGQPIIAQAAQGVWVLGLAVIVVIWPKVWIAAFAPLALMFGEPGWPLRGALVATVVLLIGPPIGRIIERRLAARRRREVATVDGDDNAAVHAELDTVTANAVEASARGRGPAAVVSTGPLLTALADADNNGDWEHFWLTAGFPDRDTLRAAQDPVIPGTTAPQLGVVSVSEAAASALRFADELRARYRFDAVSPGLLALAVLADPTCAASRILATTSDIEPRALVREAMTELVGTDLDGIDALLDEHARRRQNENSAAAGTDVEVHVTAARADEALASDLTKWLGHHAAGATGTSPNSPPARVIVLVSPAAVADPAWHRAVASLPPSPIIPVRTGPITAEALPQVLRDLNWIEWQDHDTLGSRARLAAAIAHDLERYEVSQNLRAMAEAWHRAGRPAHLLIHTLDRARRAGVHVHARAHDDLTRPIRVVTEYVDASLRATGLTARKAVRRWLFRFSLVGLVVVLAATVVVYIGLRGQHSGQAVQGAAAASMITNRPDRIAMLNAAILVQPDTNDLAAARTAITQTLATPWAVGALGQGQKTRQVAAAASGDGKRWITLDGDGTLTGWDAASQQPLWRHAVLSEQPMVYLEADSDLRTVAIATATALHVVDTSTWHDVAIPTPTRPRHIAFDPAGALAVDAGGLLLVDVSAGTLRPSPAAGTVMDLRRDNQGDLLALVRRGDELAAVDARSGEVRASTRRPAEPLENAGLGRDGAVAWSGSDRQIYLSGPDLDLHPTGQMVPDVYEILRPLSNRRVAFGGVQFGVRIYDDRAQAEVGTICRGSAGVQELAIAPDEDMIGCLDDFIVELWRTQPLSPLPDGTNFDGVGRSPQSSTTNLQFDGTTDGQVTVSARVPQPAASSTTRTLQTGTPDISALAVDDRWVIAGTTNGEVVQFAVGGSDHPTARWSSPNRAAVTAVGVDPAQKSQIVAQTSDGLWWTIPACLDCGSAAALATHVVNRLWGCYTDNQLELISDEVRDALLLKVCNPEPAATR